MSEEKTPRAAGRGISIDSLSAEEKLKHLEEQRIKNNEKNKERNRAKRAEEKKKSENSETTSSQDINESLNNDSDEPTEEEAKEFDDYINVLVDRKVMATLNRIERQRMALEEQRKEYERLENEKNAKAPTADKKVKFQEPLKEQSEEKPEKKEKEDIFMTIVKTVAITCVPMIARNLYMDYQMKKQPMQMMPPQMPMMMPQQFQMQPQMPMMMPQQFQMQPQMVHSMGNQQVVMHPQMVSPNLMQAQGSINGSQTYARALPTPQNSNSSSAQPSSPQGTAS